MKNQLRKAIGKLRHIVFELGEERYLSLKQRLGLAVPIALLMVLIGKRWQWIVELITRHMGLLALSGLGSYIIVVVVSGFAHWANRWLDTQCDWQKSFKDRLIAQLALPLAGGWIISIFMAILLFACFGIDIKASGYLRFEIWVVLFLLALLNTGYAFWYLHRHPADSESEVVYIEISTLRNDKLRISELEIAFIQAANGHRLVRMVNGDLHYTNKSIIEMEKILNPKRFYKLKRKYLINAAIIKKLVKVKKVRVNKETGEEITDYSWIVRFGNEEIGKFEEKLVKGTMKYFEAWWSASSNKKHTK